MAGIIAGVVSATEAIGQFHEGAEHGGAVVVGQRDEAGLLHEAAEFDEVAGAGAALDGPGTGVGQGAGAAGTGDGLAIPPPCPGEAVEFRPDGGG